MIKLRCSWRRMKGSNCASLMMRLAMINNDLSHAYLLLELIREYKPNDKSNLYRPFRQTLQDSDLRLGLRVYAFRMLIGHFREGIKVIDEIGKREQEEKKQNGGELLSYLRRLDKQTLEDYEGLKLFFSDPTQKDKFFMIAAGLRDTVGFHYCDKKKFVANSIAKMAEDDEASVNALVFIRDWQHARELGQQIERQMVRFPIADTVICNVIGRFIWKAERTEPADTEEAISEAMKWSNEECNTLLHFCSQMCGLYFADRNAS